MCLQNVVLQVHVQSVLQPHRALQHHALVDEDADAVRQKAAEEKKEEAETSAMAGHDKPTHVDHEVEFADDVFQGGHGQTSSAIDSST